MSREFGEGPGGFFHNKIQDAAEDCRGGDCEITKKWGRFLEEFYNLAWHISTAEACDSSEASLIVESIKAIPLLKSKMEDIEKYLGKYEAVIEKAIRERNG